MIIQYDGTSTTEYSGVWSEIFEISPTQEELSFQFKMSNSVVAGEVAVQLALLTNDYVNRVNMSNYQIGSYNFKINATTQNSEYTTYKVKIPLNYVTNVIADSIEPSTSTYWLDTSDTDYILKKYDEENEEWVAYNTPNVLKDQNNNIYSWIIWGDESYYILWSGSNTIRYGQVLIIPSGDLRELPNIHIEIGDMKAEYGVATDWAPRQDETYSINHRMDANGYTIQKGDNRLFLDEDEMTGYYQDNKMFYINKNEVYAYTMRCIEEDIDGLVTKKTTIGGDIIYVRFIR